MSTRPIDYNSPHKCRLAMFTLPPVAVSRNKDMAAVLYLGETSAGCSRRRVISFKRAGVGWYGKRLRYDHGNQLSNPAATRS